MADVPEGYEEIEDKEFSLDHSFIDEREGVKTEGYVPTKNGKILDSSGVTIGSGIDLGQWNEKKLKEAGASSDFISKSKPYIGLRGAVAQKKLAEKPLVFEDDDKDSLITLSHSVREKNIETFNNDFKKDSGYDFKDLPAELQTVMGSVITQYGPNLKDKDRAPKFYGKAKDLDITGMRDELRNFQDKYPTRRNLEADLLEPIVPTTGKIQQKLIDKGYNPGPVDDKMGPQTEGAVRQFQEDEGLTVDGIPGNKTWQGLLSALGNFIDPVASADEIPEDVPEGYLEIPDGYVEVDSEEATQGNLDVPDGYVEIEERQTLPSARENLSVFDRMLTSDPVNVAFEEIGKAKSTLDNTFEKIGKWSDEKAKEGLESYKKTNPDQWRSAYGGMSVDEVNDMLKEEQAGMEAIAKGGLNQLSFGVYSDKDAQERFPMSYAAGQLGGGLASLVMTGGALKALGLANQAVKAGQASLAVSSLGPRFIPAMIMSGATFGTHSGIIETVAQAKEGRLDIAEISGKVAKDTALGGMLGIVGSFASVPVSVGSAAGIGFTSAKIDGATDGEALVNAGMFGLFEVVGSFGRSYKLRNDALSTSKRLLADYAQTVDKKMTRQAAEIASERYLFAEAQKVGGMEKVLNSKENSLRFLEKVNQNIFNKTKQIKPTAKAKVDPKQLTFDDMLKKTTETTRTEPLTPVEADNLGIKPETTEVSVSPKGVKTVEGIRKEPLSQEEATELGVEPGKAVQEVKIYTPQEKKKVVDSYSEQLKGLESRKEQLIQSVKDEGFEVVEDKGGESEAEIYQVQKDGEPVEELTGNAEVLGKVLTEIDDIRDKITRVEADEPLSEIEMASVKSIEEVKPLEVEAKGKTLEEFIESQGENSNKKELSNIWKALNQNILVDAEDFNLLKRYSFSTKRSYGYPSARTSDKKVSYLHDIILGIDDKKGMVVDHINRNPLDNRKENLRLIPQQLNAFNTKLSKSNTSGFKGVIFDKRINKWIAKIAINGKTIHLGSFGKIEDAIDARKRGEEKYIGDIWNKANKETPKVKEKKVETKPEKASKPLIAKKTGKATPKTLIGVVRSFGGVTMQSVKDAGYTYQDLKEFGLLSIIKYSDKAKTKGGKLDSLATELANVGYIPKGSTSDDLINLLKESKGEVANKIDLSLEQTEKDWEAEYEEYRRNNSISKEDAGQIEATLEKENIAKENEGSDFLELIESFDEIAVADLKESVSSIKKPEETSGNDTKLQTNKEFSQHYERIKEEFGLPEEGVQFSNIDIKDQARRAFNYIQQNPKKALRIAYGYDAPPPAIRAQAIMQAMVVALRKSGKIAQAEEIAKKASLNLTEAAQALNIAKLDVSPKEKPDIIRKITDGRLERLGNKIGELDNTKAKDVAQRRINKRTVDATNEVKKSQIKISKDEIAEIDRMIDSILC